MSLLEVVADTSSLVLLQFRKAVNTFLSFESSFINKKGEQKHLLSQLS